MKPGPPLPEGVQLYWRKVTRFGEPQRFEVRSTPPAGGGLWPLIWAEVFYNREAHPKHRWQIRIRTSKPFAAGAHSLFSAKRIAERAMRQQIHELMLVDAAQRLGGQR
jgi:hypothetical protein